MSGSEDDAGYPLLVGQACFQEGGEPLYPTLAHPPQQLTIVEKKLTQDLGHTEHELPVRNGLRHRSFQMMGELSHLIVMAGRTEPATPAAESKQILVMTARAPYSSR